MQKKLSELTDLVWIQTAFLGDIVLSTGALNYVSQNFPDVTQHLITTPVGAKALPESNKLKIYTYDKRKNSALSSFLSLKQQLKAANALHTKSRTVQPHMSYRSSLLARFIALPTITFDSTKLSFLAQTKVPKIPLFHEANRVGLVLEPLGVSRQDVLSMKPYLPELQLEEDPSWVSSQLQEHFGSLIAISPGSKWGTKMWPLRHFQELAQKIQNQSGFPMVLLGDSSEVDLCESIASQLNPEITWNLAGKTSLDELRYLYPKLKVLITNDSSPIHYASAFNIPTYAFFGATIPEMGFGPLAAGSKVIENKSTPCRPCSLHGPMVCPKTHFNCMNSVSASQAFESIQMQLK